MWVTGEKGCSAAGEKHRPAARSLGLDEGPADLLCNQGKAPFFSPASAPVGVGLPVACSGSPAQAEGKPATWWPPGEWLWVWNPG